MNVLTSYPATSSEAIAIDIYDVLGESVLLGEEQGNRIYQIIAPAFKSGKNVILSFKKIERFTWSFASKAIAQLYEHFPEEEIQIKLNLIDISTEEVEFIEEVVETKKRYMENPEQFNEPMSDEELERLRKKEPSNPFLQIAGMFKDDPDFDEFLAEIEKYRREVDAKEEAYYSQFDEEESKNWY
ncbi:MAG: STAS-like domain-containing protein [Cyanobacteriota bacterium]|nr:STAS-like domain-containing protein [Cyanobacteriota bacterium]